MIWQKSNSQPDWQQQTWQTELFRAEKKETSTNPGKTVSKDGFKPHHTENERVQNGDLFLVHCYSADSAEPK